MTKLVLADDSALLRWRSKGMEAATWVGPPSGLERVSEPPNAARRSRMPAKPCPSTNVAPPGPWSTTEIRSVDPAVRSTFMGLSGAYFRALVMASTAKKYAAASTPSDSSGRGLGQMMRTSSLVAFATSVSAASNPSSTSACGWIPRTVARSESRPCCSVCCASRSSAARAGSSARVGESCASPSCILAATRYCWAPSWRSRSIRRRSTS